VRSIRQQDGHVLVHTDRGTVRAKRVIVAVPPPLVLDIDWHPHLPDARRNLLRRMPMGKLMKCDAVYATPFWRSAGLSGSGVAAEGVTRAVFDNSPADGHVGVLLAFVGGGSWKAVGRLPKAERRRQVLAGFAQMFGEQALHPIEYTEHDWTLEPWTTGAPTALPRLGAITHYGSSIRTPFRHVHWAGTETSTYWSGYMDGAVRSGERAAAEVLAHL
jgi:monoamine oxidase